MRNIYKSLLITTLLIHSPSSFSKEDQKKSLDASKIKYDQKNGAGKKAKFTVDTKSLKQVQRSEVPLTVPLVNSLPIYSVQLTTTTSTIASTSEESTVALEPRIIIGDRGGIYGYNPPTELYVQFDPRESNGVFVSWKPSVDMEYRLQLSINGMPVESNPPLSSGDSRDIYVGAGAGYGLWAQYGGNYEFSMDVYYQNNYLDSFQAAPISVVATSSGFWEPSAPDYVGFVQNACYEDLSTMQQNCSGSTMWAVQWGYTSSGLYIGVPPDVFYYEYRTQVNAGEWSEWRNVGYTDALYLSSMPVGLNTFEVRACNDIGCSDGTVGSVGSLAAPESISVNVDYQAGTAGYSVNWSTTSGGAATRFFLQENPLGQGWSSSINMLSATSKTYSGQLPGTYYYRVQGCNNTGCSPWSNATSVTVSSPLAQCPL